MEFNDLFENRTKLGLINITLKNPLVSKMETDEYRLNQIASNPHDVWELATSQSDLLWLLRSIGQSDVADALWDEFATNSTIRISRYAKLPTELSIEFSNWIRSKVPNPFKEI